MNTVVRWLPALTGTGSPSGKQPVTAVTGTRVVDTHHWNGRGTVAAAASSGAHTWDRIAERTGCNGDAVAAVAARASGAGGRLGVGQWSQHKDAAADAVTSERRG